MAAAFANVPAVRRVGLFGSVAGSPRRESGSRLRRTGDLHEPKDVDLAVWIDHATDLKRLRVLRSRAVNQTLRRLAGAMAFSRGEDYIGNRSS